MGTELGVLRKKNVFFVVFFPPGFWPFLAAGWCFFMFLVFFCFFMVVLGTAASCGTKEALFFEYFWHSLFLRRLLVECFFVFPSCMTYQVVRQWGTHIYGRCGMWDVGCVCHGMNMCACECKSMMTWQIEVQWGPHIYRRCGFGMLRPYVMACIRAICDHIADRGAMEVTKRK